MTTVLIIIVVLVIIAVVIWILHKQSVIQPIPQGQINGQIEETATDVSSVADNEAAANNLLSEIERKKEAAKKAAEQVAKDEAAINKTKNTPTTGPIKDLNGAKEYMKKLLGLTIIMISVQCFAFDTIPAGSKYIANVDSVVLTLDELNKIKEKLDNASKSELLVTQYEKLVSDMKMVRAYQTDMLKDYAELERLKRDSIEIYKEATESYKKIIEEFRINNTSLVKQIQSQKRTSKFQRVIQTLIGFFVGHGVKIGR